MEANEALSRFINVHDFEAEATRRLPEPSREYLNSGSADEWTLRRNRRAFEELRLLPRVLRDVGHVDTAQTLFDQPLATPMLIAPTGYHRLFHGEGEIATARGAAAAGVPFVVSTMATVPIEAIAAASDATLWFQLYVQRDGKHTQLLVERAEAAGCRAIIVTVDTPVLGSRDRERRLVFPTDGTMRAVHLEELDPTGTKRHHWEPGSIHSPLLQPALTWTSIEWIRSLTRLPLLLKGVMAAADARRAITAGVDGVIVSNHGGRNLDTVPAAIEALPAVVRAVDGRVPVLMDGGVRRGTDVLKAVALGARAVLLGRPPLWGLAVAGADGVRRIFELLQFELQTAMALAGVAALGDVNTHLIWRGRAMTEEP
jgi:4-hydroxymandelate oxidase